MGSGRAMAPDLPLHPPVKHHHIHRLRVRPLEAMSALPLGAMVPAFDRARTRAPGQAGAGRGRKSDCPAAWGRAGARGAAAAAAARRRRRRPGTRACAVGGQHPESSTRRWAADAPTSPGEATAAGKRAVTKRVTPLAAPHSGARGALPPAPPRLGGQGAAPHAGRRAAGFALLGGDKPEGGGGRARATQSAAGGGRAW